MSQLATPFYYAAIGYNGNFQSQYWDSLYPQLGAGGKFWIDIGKFFHRNSFAARVGTWSAPWPTATLPGLEMPQYDPGFSMSFAEITDRRALDIKQLILRTNAQVALYYSGGIDSTICLAALIKNLTPEELRHVHVCMSMDAVIENPDFFDKYIRRHFAIIDSASTRYNNLVDDKGFYAITADQGDCLFGTEVGIQMYYSFKNLQARLPRNSQQRLASYLQNVSSRDIHFSEYKDLIALYFDVPRNPHFGRNFYEKVAENIRSSPVPVHSLHDFFWWIIFNLKYIHCATRSSIYYYDGDDRRKLIHDTIFNWFNHPDYQKWSMVNNNNGEKIRGVTAATYKWAARQYLFDFDKNDWYLRHKLKIASLSHIVKRYRGGLVNMVIFGMDKNYEILRINDPVVKKYVEDSLARYTLDHGAISDEPSCEITTDFNQ